MRPILLFLALSGAGIITWLILARPDKKTEAPKQAALVVSKHSDSFNRAISTLLGDYEKLSELFVAWDSVAVSPAAQTMLQNVNGMNMEDLKKDSSAIYETAVAFIENIKGDLQTIASEKGIRPQRETFNNMTDNLYQLLNTVKYDREKLYLQQCPMAFDDVQSASWLSRENKIRNPYLGLKDPRYGKGMLSCGENIKVLNEDLPDNKTDKEGSEEQTQKNTK